MSAPDDREPKIAAAWGSSSITRVILGLAVLYLAGVWLDAVGSKVPEKALPRAANYFLQIAALFTRASSSAIDYRAEAWLCSEKRWSELDVRPYFRIDEGEKENRFQRVMHFYREHRKTMQALEHYVLSSHADGRADDGVPADAAVGGVRFLSLRIPIPSPGLRVERTRREPVLKFAGEERHDWYWTPRAKRVERCGAPAGDDE